MDTLSSTHHDALVTIHAFKHSNSFYCVNFLFVDIYESKTNAKTNIYDLLYNRCEDSSNNNNDKQENDINDYATIMK